MQNAKSGVGFLYRTGLVQKQGGSPMMRRLKNILTGKRMAILLGALMIVAAMPSAVLAEEPDVNRYIQAADPLLLDAYQYATEWGIEVDEAVRRLTLQVELGKFGALLKENETDTYAGHWIKHGPRKSDFGMVVRLTGNGEQILDKYGQYIENNPISGLVEVQSAEVTLPELKAMRNKAVELLTALGIRTESSINVKENQVEVYIAEPHNLNSVISESDLELPDKVELIKVSALSEEVSEIYGGLPSTLCTLGFSVQDSNGTMGVTTAGHCDDQQSYNGTDLPYQHGVFSVIVP